RSASKDLSSLGIAYRRMARFFERGALPREIFLESLAGESSPPSPCPGSALDDGCLGSPAEKSRRGRLPREIFWGNLTGTGFPREICSPGKEDDGAGLLFFGQGGERLRRCVSAGERARLDSEADELAAVEAIDPLELGADLAGHRLGLRRDLHKSL